MLNMNGYRFLHEPITEEIDESYTLTYRTRAQGSNPNRVIAQGEGLEIVFMIYDKQRDVSFMDRYGFPAEHNSARQQIFEEMKNRIRRGAFDYEKGSKGRLNI